MTHPNNAIAFNTKEKWVIKQWKNLEEPGMHITKWKKSTEKKGPLLIPIIWHHTIWHFGNGDSKKMMTAGGHKEMHRQSTEELSTVNPFCMLPSGYTSSNYLSNQQNIHQEWTLRTQRMWCDNAVSRTTANVSLQQGVMTVRAAVLLWGPKTYGNSTSVQFSCECKSAL